LLKVRGGVVIETGIEGADATRKEAGPAVAYRLFKK